MTRLSDLNKHIEVCNATVVPGNIKIKRPVQFHNIDCDILTRLIEQDVQMTFGEYCNSVTVYLSNALFNYA